MFRFMICFFVPLFVPWGVWVLNRKIKKRSLKHPPYEKLLISGVVLAVLTLSAFSVSGRFPAFSSYVPARFENGVLTPAHFESVRK